MNHNSPQYGLVFLLTLFIHLADQLIITDVCHKNKIISRECEISEFKKKAEHKRE
jgi:hypothetical protein